MQPLGRIGDLVKGITQKERELSALTFRASSVFACVLWKLIKYQPLSSAVKITVLPVSVPARDGEQIETEEDQKYLFSDDSSELTIRKVDKNDEAEYVCIAENKAGEQDASIHLKVFGKDSAAKVIALPRFL